MLGKSSLHIFRGNYFGRCGGVCMLDITLIAGQLMVEKPAPLCCHIIFRTDLDRVRRHRHKSLCPPVTIRNSTGCGVARRAQLNSCLNSNYNLCFVAAAPRLW